MNYVNFDYNKLKIVLKRILSIFCTFHTESESLNAQENSRKEPAIVCSRKGIDVVFYKTVQYVSIMKYNFICTPLCLLTTRK